MNSRDYMKFHIKLHYVTVNLQSKIPAKGIGEYLSAGFIYISLTGPVAVVPVGGIN